MLAASLSGTLLPLKLLYKGRTDLCHPKYLFPSDRYIDEIIILYVTTTRDEPNLPFNHKALAIFNVFKTHKSKAVNEKLKKKNRESFVFLYQQTARTSFSQWTRLGTQKSCGWIEKGNDFEEIIKSIDLRTSVIKSIMPAGCTMCLMNRHRCKISSLATL
ncbi:hypothetical protein KUTeg_018773 [Tegillarca granosa]|uniref:Uncharacterized protein n=1 Tax=Tegillarca granosa TaxID=220873 RepID=A0ABQ9EED3_TEGGR|nr:hypothetical protein KUTeg_018773 [Tegillarca granosa]